MILEEKVKKKILFSSLIVLIAMVFTASQALAAPPPWAKGGSKDNSGKSNQSETEDHGNGHGNSQGQNNNGKGNDHQQQNNHDQNQKKGKPDHFRGVVTAKTDTTLTLKLADGSTQIIGVDASTIVKIPTMKNATLADLNLNVQVVVQARGTDSSGNPLASKILVVPGKPITVHRVGMVIAYTPANGATNGSITVKDQKGDTSTFVVTSTTKIIPESQASLLVAGTNLTGPTVTIISRRDPTGGPLTAEGIVIHSTTSTDSSDSSDSSTSD